MNWASHAFESRAWIVLAIGCFLGGVLFGASLVAEYHRRRTRPPADIWKHRFAGFNRPTQPATRNTS